MKSKPHSLIEQVKGFVRCPFAWPGMYTQLLLMQDASILCHDCVMSNFVEIIADISEAYEIFVHWEGAPLICDSCGAYLEAEYS